MQLNEAQLEELNVLVKTDGYKILVGYVEGMISAHVDEVNTIEELYFSKGQSDIFDLLSNLETYVEQAHDL